MGRQRIMSDNVAGAKEGCGTTLGEHRPTDEERAVIGLVGSCREREEVRLIRAEGEAMREKSKRGIGPVFLRRHHFGPEFVLRVNHRVKPL